MSRSALSPAERSIKRARTLSDAQFRQVLEVVRQASPLPEIDELALLLSFYAALRVSEIASLTVAAVTDADGGLSQTIWIHGAFAKGGRQREIPMHPDIRTAIVAVRHRHPGLRYLSPRRTDLRRPTTPGALAAWFKRLYASAGFDGCSSHSGRRTCITNLAQRANRFHNSLRDVQLIAGHARLETTSAYIAPSANSAAMVASLGTTRPTRPDSSQR